MNIALRYGKTGLTWGVLVSTIAWSMGLAALLTPFTSAQAVGSGDLIKASQAAVYYYGEDGKRYVFPNQKTYNTWYSNFSGVITISDSELANIPIGGNATYKPGVKMVKITTDPKVYVVDANGTLRPIANEAEAVTLYGATWNTMIDDVPDAFFTNYKVGGSATGFDKVAATAAATSINDDKNIVAGGNTGGGSLTVSLAADTPVTGSIPASAARVPFTKINLTNNTALDAIVDQIVIERMGLAQDAAISSIDVIGPDGIPVNEFSKTLGSEHTSTINDDFTVKANSTMAITIAANMASSLTNYAGELPVLVLKTITLKGGGSVSGALPIAGNHNVLNGTISIGTVKVATGANNPSAATKEIGTKDYVVTSFNVTAGSAENLMVNRVIFTNNGSGSPSDVENLKLVNSNTNAVLATKTTVDQDKVIMDINQMIEKGKNATYDLRLDIQDGSARTISYDIDQQADLDVKGLLYGHKILGTFPSSSTPYFNAADTTVGVGTLQIESIAVTPTNISEGLNRVTIGKFKFVTKGEPINITQMGWSVIITNQSGSVASSTDITNFTVTDGNGLAVVAGISLTDHTTGGADATSKGNATTTDTISTNVGEEIYTIKADLSTDFTSNDTIQVRTTPANITAKGDVSGQAPTITPSAEVSGTSLTVKAAALSVSNSSVPAAQTVVAGAQGFTAANIALDGTNSGDDLRITSIAIGHKHTGASFPNMLSGWKLMDGVTNIPITEGSPTCSGATCNTAGTVQATTTLTINQGVLIVPKGTSKTLAVLVNVGTGATSGTFAVYCGNGTSGCIGAIDSAAQSITNTYTNDDGQSMTLAAGGTLNTAILTDPKANIVIGGSKVEVGRFTLEPKNEGVNFNSFGIHVTSPDGGIVGNQDEISAIELCQVGGSCYGPIAVNTSRATITPTGLTQTANQEKTYVLNATFNSINNSSPAQSGAGVKFLVGNIDVTGTSVGSSSVTVSGLGTSFNTFSVFKSIPTVSKVAFSGSDVVTGNTTVNLYKLSVSADNAGPVSLFRMTFGINTSTVTLTASGYYLYESDSSSSLGSIIAQGSDITKHEAATNGQTQLRAYLDVNNDNSIAPALEHRVLSAGTTKYYTLVGTISNGHDVTVDNESISTVLAGDGAFDATSAQNAVTLEGSGDTSDFIWSDLHLDLYATSSATTAVMWFNGYRVPGLDTTSSTPQTITD